MTSLGNNQDRILSLADPDAPGTAAATEKKKSEPTASDGSSPPFFSPPPNMPVVFLMDTTHTDVDLAEHLSCLPFWCAIKRPFTAATGGLVSGRLRADGRSPNANR